MGSDTRALEGNVSAMSFAPQPLSRVSGWQTRAVDRRGTGKWRVGFATAAHCLKRVG